MREAGKYVWLDDLKERRYIEECTNDTDILTIGEFEKRMSERFATCDEGERKQNELSAFEDKDGKKRPVRQSRLWYASMAMKAFRRWLLRIKR